MRTTSGNAAGRDVREAVTGRISAAAHALLATGMVAMAWVPSSATVLPRQVRAVVFGSTAVWFVVTAGPRWLANVHHALMAAAMCWMAVVPRHAGHGGPGSAMASALGALLGAYFVLAVPAWIVGAVRAATAASGATGATGASGATGATGRRARGDVVHAVMSSGMGLLLLAAS
jgi:hypothetical protein